MDAPKSKKSSFSPRSSSKVSVSLTRTAAKAHNKLKPSSSAPAAAPETMGVPYESVKIDCEGRAAAGTCGNTGVTEIRRGAGGALDSGSSPYAFRLRASSAMYLPGRIRQLRR